MSYPIKCPKCGENYVNRVASAVLTERGYIDNDGDFRYLETVDESEVDVKSIRCRNCQTLYKETP